MTPKSDWRRIATLEDAIGHGLKKDEFEGVRKLLGRELNLVEVGICAALYSEHCSYKSTRHYLKDLTTTGARVIQGPGENAGVVDIGDNQAVVFKVESHNHPTFIEPFQGAATGVGGIMRDVFTMGARPLALLNSLRFGEPTIPRTRYLTANAVKGIGHYGNCMGVPTVGGEIFFDKAYNGNCLVNAFCLGLIDHDKVFLGRASGIGNPVFYFGSKTGRDGIHGATMASESFDEKSEEKRPTVQVGDPFQEKLLLEATLAVMQSGAVVGIQDMGAAGLTSSSFEMADRAGNGVRLYLDRVPQRETEMNPYELMLSESQERMLMVVEKGREEEVLKIISHWEIDIVQIGEVISGGEVELYWHGECVSKMSAALLTSSVPKYRWAIAARVKAESSAQQIDPPADLAKVWLEILGSPNNASRHPLFNQYDSTVRSNTVIHPGSDAGVIRIKNPAGVEKGVAMKLDCNSRYCEVDPYQGAAHAVVEGMRNVSATGAEPIGLSDCLNCGNPERPVEMWKIAESIRGLGDAARELGVPIVSGNVSLYNETKTESILPTPLIATVGLIQDASKALGSEFVNEGDIIFLFGDTDPSEIGGSEYLHHCTTQFGNSVPKLNYELEGAHAKFVRELIDARLLQSCHDLSSGGLGMALVECCLTQYRANGASLTPTFKLQGRPDLVLFAETGARYLASASPVDADEVQRRAKSIGIPVTMTGRVGGAKIEIVGIASIALADATSRWRNGLNFIFE